MNSPPRRSTETVDTTAAPVEHRTAAALRGFGPLGLLAIAIILIGNAVIVPLSAVLVLVWARVSRTPFRDIGFVRPDSWVATIAGGILLGVGLKFFMKAIVMPLLGADPINQAVRHLTGNTAALPWALYALVIGAGFGEETLFRGYLFERFGKLIGRGTVATLATVVITSVWFGLDHYGFQGTAGVQQATIIGLLYGTIFAVTGRIWFLIVVHAAFNLTALWMIYFNREWDVAHLVFK